MRRCAVLGHDRAGGDRPAGRGEHAGGHGHPVLLHDARSRGGGGAGQDAGASRGQVHGGGARAHRHAGLDGKVAFVRQGDHQRERI